MGHPVHSLHLHIVNTAKFLWHPYCSPHVIQELQLQTSGEKCTGFLRPSESGTVLVQKISDNCWARVPSYRSKLQPRLNILCSLSNIGVVTRAPSRLQQQEAGGRAAACLGRRSALSCVWARIRKCSIFSSATTFKSENRMQPHNQLSDEKFHLLSDVWLVQGGMLGDYFILTKLKLWHLWRLGHGFHNIEYYKLL